MVEVRHASRVLFDAEVMRLPDEEVPQLIAYWKHFRKEFGSWSLLLYSKQVPTSACFANTWREERPTQCHGPIYMRFYCCREIYLVGSQVGLLVQFPETRI